MRPCVELWPGGITIVAPPVEKRVELRGSLLDIGIADIAYLLAQVGLQIQMDMRPVRKRKRK